MIRICNLDGVKKMTDLYKQPLIIPYKESGDLYELVEDYRINLLPFGYNITLNIHKGFKYDGASVPRWLWSLAGFSSDGLHRASALVHDYLYVQKGKVISADGTDRFEFTREECDKLLRDMMEAVSIAEHRVWLAYHAVKWFGKHVWDN